MKKFSLSISLTLNLLVITIISWGLSFFYSYMVTNNGLEKYLDRYQITMAEIMATVDWSLDYPDSDEIIRDLYDKSPAERDDTLNSTASIVYDKDGNMIFTDGKSNGVIKFEKDVVGFKNQTSNRDNIEKKWKVYWTSSNDGKYIIGVGQNLGYRRDDVIKITKQAFIPRALLLLLFIGLSIYVIYKKFAPLRTIVKDLSSRNPNDLSPLDYKNAPKEVEPLLVAISCLMNRLNNMLTIEKNFISAAAHELRSPLTALNVQLEVALMSDDDPKARKKALENLNHGMYSTVRLVEQLLTLSKLEVPSILDSVEQEKLNWKNIINEIVGEYKNRFDEKNIKIETNITNNSPIKEGNKVLIGLLVRNIIDNAAKYTSENGRFFIEVTNNKLTSINSSLFIKEEYISKLGERFFRPPGQKEKGSGIGIAIISKIADLYNCKVVVQNITEGFMIEIIKK